MNKIIFGIFVTAIGTGIATAQSSSFSQQDSVGDPLSSLFSRSEGSSPSSTMGSGYMSSGSSTGDSRHASPSSRYSADSNNVSTDVLSGGGQQFLMLERGAEKGQSSGDSAYRHR